MAREQIKQCRTCPWRVGAELADIPNYSESLHCGLAGTIKSGLESLFGAQRIMACHYSTDEKPIACAGWLANQLGPATTSAPAWRSSLADFPHRWWTARSMRPSRTRYPVIAPPPAVEAAHDRPTHR